MIAENSLSAYRSIEHRLGEKQLIVYYALKKHGKPLNNRMLAERLGWSINRVTPRVLELREMGLVVERIVAIDPVTRKRTSFWGVSGDEC